MLNRCFGMGLLLAGVLLAGCAYQPPAPSYRQASAAADLSPYRLRLVAPTENETLRHEDMFVRVLFGFPRAHGEGYNGINLSIQNKTGSDFTLLWDRFKFIGYNGFTSKVAFNNFAISEEALLEDVASEPETIGAGDTLEVTVYPIRSFSPDSNGQFRSSSFLPGIGEASVDGERIGLFITLQSAQLTKYYTFHFKIEDTRLLR